MDAVDVDKPMKKWDDEDQYQLHHEYEEVEGICFKTRHCSA